MNVTEILAGQWLPDEADYQNPGLTKAENCYPSSGGYAPFNGPATANGTTTEPVKGAVQYFLANDNALICGGGSTRLFTWNAGTVTETTGYTALDANERWRFARFNDRVVAVSPKNAPQTLDDLDTDTTWAALGGAPPKAAVCGRVDDFLFLGDLTDIDDSVQPSRVRWGARNNPEGDWVTDRGNLSDFRTLEPRYGRVTGIVPGRVGLVFQDRAVYRAEFTGAPLAFDFPLVSVENGCIAPDSIVQRGALTYFLSDNGFCVTDGSSVNVISSLKVIEWFEAEANAALKKVVQGAINWSRRCIVWNFIPASGDGYSRQIIYNFEVDGWSYGSLENQWIIPAKRGGTTLGDLGTEYPGGLGDIDEELGSPDFLPQSRSTAVFTASGDGAAYKPLTGGALQAQFETGDFQPVKGSRAFVSGLRAMVEADAATAETQVMGRDRLGAGYTVTTPQTEAADGFAPHRLDKRFLAARATLPAGSVWDNFTGFQARVRASGRR